MTTLAGVADAAFADCDEVFACDISFSRIRVGRSFVERVISKERLTALTPFVGDLFRLPFLDNSIDLVWTAHALEPNGGREVTALEEFFRVSSQSVVLFEPSYEENSLEGRRRMESLGYVRGLPMAITQAGGELMASFPLRNVGNALNPTWAYVCRKAERGTRRNPRATLGVSRVASCDGEERRLLLQRIFAASLPYHPRHSDSPGRAGDISEFAGLTVCSQTADRKP